jgi:hypothetical protein
VITLLTPFLYDPALGNLLLDVRNFSGGLTTQFDAQRVENDSISRVLTTASRTALVHLLPSSATHLGWSRSSGALRYLSLPPYSCSGRSGRRILVPSGQRTNLKCRSRATVIEITLRAACCSCEETQRLTP